jgi:hypothetical protein
MDRLTNEGMGGWKATGNGNGNGIGNMGLVVEN